MQLPIQTQPIDRHHRNGLSNIPLSGITPSAKYRGYSDSNCNLLTVDKSATNPCQDFEEVNSYREKGAYGGYGRCTICTKNKVQAVNNALKEALPFY